ncbi:hypothetical protein SUGI_1177780 [Cryptomeria japonica]|nr:hypothetical protein SUGI_1177780 [Cryptomeria japonica]
MKFLFANQTFKDSISSTKISFDVQETKKEKSRICEERVGYPTKSNDGDDHTYEDVPLPCPTIMDFSRRGQMLSRIHTKDASGKDGSHEAPKIADPQEDGKDPIIGNPKGGDKPLDLGGGGTTRDGDF